MRESKWKSVDTMKTTLRCLFLKRKLSLLQVPEKPILILLSLWYV